MTKNEYLRAIARLEVFAQPALDAVRATYHGDLRSYKVHSVRSSGAELVVVTPNSSGKHALVAWGNGGRCEGLGVLSLVDWRWVSCRSL